MTAPTVQTLTGEQWLDIFLTLSPADKIRAAAHAATLTADTERGQQCWMGNHEERITGYSDLIKALHAALDDLEKALPELSDDARPGVSAAIRRISSVIGRHR